VPAFALAQIGQAPQLPGSSIAQFVDPLPVLHLTSATDLTLVMDRVPVARDADRVPTRIGHLHRNVGVGLSRPRRPDQQLVHQPGRAGDAQRHDGDPLAQRPAEHEREPPGLLAQLGRLDAALGPTRSAWDLRWGHYDGAVPTVPHLHGGEIPPTLDGGPDAWFTNDGAHHGSAYHTFPGAAANEAIYRYPNRQEAANLWFHDHALGITRLNVYAGLAGAYLLRDPAQALPAGLTAYGIGSETIVPVVIQDRKFDVDGQLYFDNEGINPDLHPYWVPEFVGDTIVVNGKVWPTFGTQSAPKPSKRYRFLFVNGSNARAYALHLVDMETGVQGPPLWVIGTEGGYLDRPVRLDPSQQNGKLVLMPGERYDVIVDFNDPAWRAANPHFSGRLLLRNTARTPFPAGEPAHGSTTGRILKLFLGAPVADTGYDPRSGIPLRAPLVRLVDPATGTAAVTPALVRQLTLNEVMAPGGPVEVLVNNTHWDGRSVATDLFPAGCGRTRNWTRPAARRTT
jgi:FtsP/CotA-like multicopper oxidase with cupredoxin domain